MLFERPAPGHLATAVSVRFSNASGDVDDADSHRDEFLELVRSAALVIAATVVAVRDKPQPRWFIGSGKVDELRSAIERTGTQRRGVQSRAHPGSAAQSRRTSAMPRDDAHRTDPAHLCRARPHARRPPAGRTGPARPRADAAHSRLSAPGPPNRRGRRRWARRWRSDRRHRAARCRRDQLELDQRMLAVRIRQVRARLDGVQRRRQQSRRRRSRVRVPTVALVGYTNARQVHAFQRPYARQRAGRRSPVRDAGSHHAAARG